MYFLVNIKVETLQPKYGNLFGRFGYPKLHKALSSLGLLTTGIKSVDDNLHQVCSSQIASSLWMTTSIKPAVHNLLQVCSSQLASSL
jgi:hypothetical protein